VVANHLIISTLSLRRHIIDIIAIFLQRMVNWWLS